MTAKRKPCKDCGPMSKRPAPYPGPRCATHHREEQKRRRKAAHDSYASLVYGLSPGDYDRLVAIQEGVCDICRRHTGRKRRLAIDHDHKTGKVRGLLCFKCNQLLGHARDEVSFFKRAIEYLTNPPANEL